MVTWLNSIRYVSRTSTSTLYAAVVVPPFLTATIFSGNQLGCRTVMHQDPLQFNQRANRWISCFTKIACITRGNVVQKEIQTGWCILYFASYQVAATFMYVVSHHIFRHTVNTLTGGLHPIDCQLLLLLLLPVDIFRSRGLISSFLWPPHLLLVPSAVLHWQWIDTQPCFCLVLVV